MFNLKTALKGAAAGFVISFIAGIVGRVDFLIILLRAFLSAVFSGALLGGLGVLYNAFLGGGGGDLEFSPGVSKTPPSGSVVDITLTDDELPDSDTAPDFALAPNMTVFDAPSAVSDDSNLDKPASVPSAEEPVPRMSIQSVEPPSERQASKSGVFEPVALGKHGAAVSPSVSGEPHAAEVIEAAVSADADDVIDAEETSAEASESASAAEGELIDSLPDIDGFSGDEQYFEEDNDDTFGAVSSRGSASHSSRGDNPVDISDAKNIADAIRTALKKES